MKNTAIALLIVFCLTTQLSVAQCPMCVTSVESSRESGNTVGEKINSGILYLLTMPFLAFAVVGTTYWYKHRARK